mgnify:FL=1
MFEFILNGSKVTSEEDISLLTYLRDVKNLTSVKNGCNEGSCGACMILVDGKAMRSCLLTTRKIHGKKILTVEGFQQFEKEVYRYAFTKAGAVQCGFCTPGMLISAKGLLDNNLNPTTDEIRKAIRGNICRCTGYVKIIEAIKMAASLLKTGKLVVNETVEAKVGTKYPRIDATDKILGKAIYVDDLKVDNMLYGSALRSKYPRSIVKSIDTAMALEHPECVAIITAKDIPGKRYIGHLVQDWPALIDVGEETRYVGDAICLVAAKTKAALADIKALINVSYEELTPITTPERALAKNAPKIHPQGNVFKVEKLKRGNVDEAIKKAKYVVTHQYTTPFTEHAFLEPESSLGLYEDGIVTVYTGSQGVYDEQREIAELLGVPKSNVRTISKYVGGAFGGKEDMSVQHHAAILAYLLKQPVKVTLSRKESIMVHPKRHAMEMTVTTACDEAGNLTAFKANIISDTGAYGSLGGPVLQRACTHAAGPYRCKNIAIEGTAVYTNNPPAGAFRGFGVTQSVFASESNLNELANLVGISPWEIRYKNAILPGEALPNGQIADRATAIKETLLAVKAEYEQHKYAGIACCMKNSGLGVGVPDFGRCRIVINKGKLHVRTSAARVGQGLSTIILQIICETTGIDPLDVIIEAPDSFLTPDSGTSTASRQTLFTGEACRIAALKLKEKLKQTKIKNLENTEYYGEYQGITDPINSEKENPVSHVTYGYATQVVILDDKGKVSKVIASHDVGRAINPLNIEGQIEGGVVMGLGYALTEDYPLENGYPKAKFGTLGLFRATDIPEISSIIIEKNNSELAYGAKGIGEITTIPTAPAVQGAYFLFDGKFRTKLPLEATFYRSK